MFLFLPNVIVIGAFFLIKKANAQNNPKNFFCLVLHQGQVFLSENTEKTYYLLLGVSNR